MKCFTFWENIKTIIINNNNNKTCNAHISTLLGVQGAVKPKTKQKQKQKQNTTQRKTDTTTISILDMKNYGFILNTCHDTAKRAETRVGFPVIFSWLRWSIEPKLSQVWYFIYKLWYTKCGPWTILFTESVKWLKSGRWFELHSTKQWKSHHNQGACPICSSELWKIGLFSGNFLQNQGELAALSHSSYQVTGQQLVYRLNYKIWDLFYKALYQLNYPNVGDGTLPILSIFLHGDINQRPFPL